MSALSCAITTTAGTGDRARVGGVADQVDGAAEHALGSEQGHEVAAERLRVPEARLSGARSADGAPGGRPIRVGSGASSGSGPMRSDERHSGGDVHLHESRALLGERLRERPLKLLARGDLLARDPVASSGGGHVEAGQVEAGAPVTLSSAENHLRIEYSWLRRTRNLIGML